MKNKFILFALVAMASLLTMCSEDEKINPAASITLDPASDSGKPGEVVSVNVGFDAPNGAQDLYVYVNGVEEDFISVSGVSSPYTYEYTVPTDATIGSTIALAFQLIDAKGYPSQVANFLITVGETLSGTLTTRTLDAAQQYFIKGQVFIPNGVTVTIPAGTILKGDKATKATLIVQPGGKLVCNGEANNPVVFTSAQPVGARDRGDWGGIVMLGNAWVNQSAQPAIEGITPTQKFGSTTAEGATPTTNANENSGTLRYVRIEYAGIELTPNNETNSLTLGGVGNGTTMEYVQVSYGGDDGFEWFGGTVNGKYLVSLSTWDDDFDTDFGFQGNIQFGLVVRNPFFGDQSGSNAFECDNAPNANDTPSGASGYTRPVFSNITVLGPRDFTTGLGSGTSARSISANYQNAIHIRRRVAISIFNSFFSGFPVGVRLDDQATLDNLNNGTSRHAFNVLASPNNTVLGTSTSSSNVAFATGLSGGDATTLQAYWTNNNNTLVNPSAGAPWSPTPGTPANSVDPYPGLGLNQNMFWGGSTSSTYPSNPNFTVTAGTLSSGADFTDPKLPGSFFTSTTYRGAFGATDWTDGWAEFQPLSKIY
ncbi:MAG: hypothetical protein JNN04_09775 [Cyclobacteriaceae bacterium]|nr:hypothetical protein [Cyclobacteriaceae bacterium]